MNALELKVPPPVIALVLAALMWLVSQYEPTLDFHLPWRTAVAITLFGSGIAIAPAALLEFYRANTTVNPLNPDAATVMVTSGIYRVSRNPMYLGLLLALFGWAVWLSHLLTFALPPLFVLFINRFQIVPEERTLSTKFGVQFNAYTRAVRRWV